MDPSDAEAQPGLTGSTDESDKRWPSSLRTAVSEDDTTDSAIEDSSAFHELLNRAGKGDHDAAQTIVQTYEREIRRYIRVRLSTSSLHRLLDSVDIAQSVFARFFREGHIEQLTETNPQRVLRLLITMARNRLIDHARSHRSQRQGGSSEHVHSDQSLQSIEDRRADPANAVADHELLETVRMAMGASDRELLDARLEGCDWAELSLRFDATPEALRKRCTRAVDRAAHELGLIETPDE